ncbi:hypothetical protein MNQ96_14910 [Sphingopyxis granuli]|uniref:hypothetical protein n=1 Tax=Sphingopyxis granuli TaxID=267128 RepID=UPI001F5313EF|nr:hypothetical protein [Sphingopyxis granuli]UNK78824.1 hypothetical protein MNQ96_14910 [Sphingopyxis granuli]
MTNASGDEREALDTEQHALKICANSTSYGIWMQVNVAKRAKRFTATVYGHDGKSFARETDKAEKPGEYFHPLLASLITGAARLMLAITECQIDASGLEWAFCDTDSMAIAKPDAMADDAFRQRVEGIADWFAPLNPYEFGGSILKVESENFSLDTGAPEPLYCWAVSSKRYALFNCARDSGPIMRKVSAHGLGHLRPPYHANNAPDSIPAPHGSVLRSNVERWHSDLWFQYVSAAFAGHPDRPMLEFHPALKGPAISRYGATAPELLRWFDGFNANRPYRGQVKPFGFLLSLSAKRDWSCVEIVAGKSRRGRPPKAQAVKPVAPFDTDPAKVAATAFDRESGQPVPANALQSYAETLAQYHLHPESKFLGGNYLDRGTTRRRHVRVTGIRHIGKEANEWERRAILGRDAGSDPDYGFADGSVAVLLRELAQLADIVGIGTAAKALRISPRRLRSILAENSVVDDATRQSLSIRLPPAMAEAINLCAARAGELQTLCQLVQSLGYRGAARRLNMDPSNLQRKIARLAKSTR